MTSDPARPTLSSGNSALEAAVDRTALAAMLDARGRAHEAQETLRRVLPILEDILGAGHYEVGVALESLATMSSNAGRHAEAAALFDRAAVIFERTLGISHSRTVACLANRDIAAAGTGNQGHGD